MLWCTTCYTHTRKRVVEVRIWQSVPCSITPRFAPRSLRWRCSKELRAVVRICINEAQIEFMQRRFQLYFIRMYRHVIIFRHCELSIGESDVRVTCNVAGWE